MKIIKILVITLGIGLAFAVVGSIKHQGAVFADTTCGQNGEWVGANISVEVENSSGAVVGYSSNFQFFVTALVPVGSPAVPYLNQTVLLPSGASNPGTDQEPSSNPSYDSFTSSSISSIGHTNSCSVSGSNEPVYDFTDGSNGNDYLNCLGGATHQVSQTESAAFAFTPVSVGDFPAGQFIGGATYLWPSASQDLNKQNFNIQFIYQESGAYSNAAELSAYGSTPSGGNISRGQVLSFVPGMENTGTSAAPGTSVEFRAYSNYQDVSQYGSVPDGDPYVYSDGYNSGCMSSGEGCVPHYYWLRSESPAYGQTDWNVQYQPSSYQVNNSAGPGDQICFHTAATPADSSGGAAYSTPLCYSVSVPVTCAGGAATVDPASPQPGQAFSISFTFGSYQPNGSQGSVSVLINGRSYDATYSGGAWKVTFNGGLPGSYGTNNITYSFNSSTSGLGSASGCTGQFSIAAKPYFRVFGGDVSVGVDSRYPVSCFDNTSGYIDSFNNTTPGSGNEGAGTTQALLATGSVNGFVSGQSSNLFSVLDPLTFANTSGTYGGSYVPTAQTCSTAQDYYSQAASTAQIIQSDSGTTIATSCANIGAMTISTDSRYICYTTGNVTISGDITYNLAGANSANLPSFEVVTKGNIYIDTDVKTLTGTYIAENGSLCDTGSSCDIDVPTLAQENASTKNEWGDTLTVRGTIIANKIDLARTNGSLANDTITISSPTDPADSEEFDYSPINWLAPGDINNPQIDSITSLPPVF
ncbi:MAG: hypothetical protein WDN66_04045 [Candidatus Saccharibacteria bacterium]